MQDSDSIKKLKQKFNPNKNYISIGVARVGGLSSPPKLGRSIGKRKKRRNGEKLGELSLGKFFT